MAKKIKLSANLKERTKTYEIKFGFINALEVKYTDEQLQAILDGFEQQDDDSKYYVIDEEQNIVAALVRTLEEGDPNEAVESEKTEAYYKKQKITKDLWQTVFWSCKCKAAPAGKLGLKMSKEQYSNLEDDTAYMFIGPLQRQWSKKGDDGKYVNSDEEKEGYYEQNTLSLTEYIN